MSNPSPKSTGSAPFATERRDLLTALLGADDRALERRFGHVKSGVVEPPDFNVFETLPRFAPQLPEHVSALVGHYQGRLGEMLGVAAAGRKAPLSAIKQVGPDKFEKATLNERREAAAALSEIAVWTKKVLADPDTKAALNVTPGGAANDRTQLGDAAPDGVIARGANNFAQGATQLAAALRHENRMARAFEDIHHQMKMTVQRAMDRAPDHAGAGLMVQIIAGNGRARFSPETRSDEATRPRFGLTR